jgi:hypothetical protein
MAQDQCRRRAEDALKRLKDEADEAIPQRVESGLPSGASAFVPRMTAQGPAKKADVRLKDKKWRKKVGFDNIKGGTK